MSLFIPIFKSQHLQHHRQLYLRHYLLSGLYRQMMMATVGLDLQLKMHLNHCIIVRLLPRLIDGFKFLLCLIEDGRAVDQSF